MPVDALLPEALHMAPVLDDAMPDGPLRAGAQGDGVLPMQKSAVSIAASAGCCTGSAPGLCTSDGRGNDEGRLHAREVSFKMALIV